MPRVATPCRSSGCVEIATSQGECAACAKRRDRVRGTPASRGYDSRHKRWRAYILQRDPFCRIQVKCNGAPSTVADHITPLSKGGTWDYDNGQGCCVSCHSWKNAMQDGGFGR